MKLNKKCFELFFVRLSLKLLHPVRYIHPNLMTFIVTLLHQEMSVGYCFNFCIMLEATNQHSCVDINRKVGSFMFHRCTRSS